MWGGCAWGSSEEATQCVCAQLSAGRLEAWPCRGSKVTGGAGRGVSGCHFSLSRTWIHRADFSHPTTSEGNQASSLKGQWNSSPAFVDLLAPKTTTLFLQLHWKTTRRLWICQYFYTSYISIYRKSFSPIHDDWVYFSETSCATVHYLLRCSSSCDTTFTGVVYVVALNRKSTLWIRARCQSSEVGRRFLRRPALESRCLRMTHAPGWRPWGTVATLFFFFLSFRTSEPPGSKLQSTERKLSRSSAERRDL